MTAISETKENRTTGRKPFMVTHEAIEEAFANHGTVKAAYSATGYNNRTSLDKRLREDPKARAAADRGITRFNAASPTAPADAPKVYGRHQFTAAMVEALAEKHGTKRAVALELGFAKESGLYPMFDKYPELLESYERGNSRRKPGTAPTKAVDKPESAPSPKAHEASDAEPKTTPLKGETALRCEHCGDHITGRVYQSNEDPTKLFCSYTCKLNDDEESIVKQEISYEELERAELNEVDKIDVDYDRTNHVSATSNERPDSVMAIGANDTVTLTREEYQALMAQNESPQSSPFEAPALPLGGDAGAMIETARAAKEFANEPDGLIARFNRWLQRRGPETVDHPDHYNQHPKGIECIDVVEEFGFNTGNAIKYLWRADEKGAPIEDLQKAAWYINREIERRAR